VIITRNSDDSFKVVAGGGRLIFTENYEKSDINVLASADHFKRYIKGTHQFSHILAGEERLISSGEADDKITLQYSTYGAWTDTAGTVANNRYQSAIGYSVFGTRTKTNDMPTGSATYRGYVEGHVWKPTSGQVIGTDQEAIAGYFTTSINFGTSLVTTEFKNMQTFALTPDSKGVKWRNFTSVGTLSGNGFTGSVSALTTVGHGVAEGGIYTGSLTGALFGPSAAEIGGVWSVNVGNEHAVGVILGKKQP
jgi:hypothetical protein